MAVLHDAPGACLRITVTEENAIRYLLLNGCEEGAMYVHSDDPVFNYLWFHKCSVLAERRPSRLLVLGAGSFSAAKCLALDFPEAIVDVVDVEPELEAIARRFFHLDHPAFAGIRFHGLPAETFLAGQPGLYDFIFDDLFDGFQHVPLLGQGPEHVGRLCGVLIAGGVCIKNLIWNPLLAHTRATCEETIAAWRTTFPHYARVVLGDPAGGHNLILLGRAGEQTLDWTEVRPRLAAAAMPETLLEQCHGDE
jgi:hypothetical protein